MEPTGGVVRVDTAAIAELAERARRSGEDLARAGDGLLGLAGVPGLVVGAQAVHDALGDLVRQWGGVAAALRDDGVRLGHVLEQVRAAAEACEGRVSGLVCAPGPAAAGGPGSAVAR